MLQFSERSAVHNTLQKLNNHLNQSRRSGTLYVSPVTLMSRNSAPRLDPIRQPMPADISLVLLLGIMWGSAFPTIKIAVGVMEPSHLVMVRTGIGAAVLVAWMWLRSIAFPRDLRTWALLMFMACLNTVLPYFLIAWGEQYVEAGIAALLMGSGPLFALLISHLTTHDDRLSGPKLLGVALGFAGVMTIVGTSALQGLGRDLLGQIAIFSANLCYVISGAMIRYIRGVRLEAMAATNLVCGFVLCLPLIPIYGLPPLRGLGTEAVLAITWLGVVVTGVTYVMRFHITRSVGYSFMALASYAVPVSGVVLAALWLGETLSARVIIALVLIISGFATARIRRRSLRQPDL